MEFVIKVREVKELLKRTGNKNKFLTDAIRYQDDNRGCKTPADRLTDVELNMLVVVVNDRIKEVSDDRHNKWLRGRLNTFFELHNEQITDNTIVSKLEQLAPAIKRYLEKNAPHRWVFQEGSDHLALPYFVHDIKYQKRTRDRHGVNPAYVRISTAYYEHGETESGSDTLYEDRWHPMTVPQALQQLGLLAETPKAVTTYLEELERYGQLQSACGKQLYAIGDAYSAGESRWYSSSFMIPMVREGSPTRVVLDTMTEEIESNKGGDESRVKSFTFWDEIPERNGSQTAVEELESDDENGPLEDDEKSIEVNLPLHPYLYVFDLDKHRWCDIHVSNLQPYEWDKTLLDKLKLPVKQKGLMKVLMSTTGNNIGDIIRGKMQGTIVIATGPPGVGKTLTAEVFSEFIERPLYVVQCSQLGLDVDAIEKNLQGVLGRASRWGAVLLIDEADVYIRRRGEDINQNAIVGVFLRLLEYYRGILFMASNRDEIIDDAILSRATAWIKYELPSEELLWEIWKVLGQQFKVTLTEEDLDLLVKKLPEISGRSVRNILKLATLLKGSKATTEDIITMSEYQALEKGK